jgi:hypothetical protein
MTKTAVQWIAEKFKQYQQDREKMSWKQVIDTVELALAMEKEQIVEAFWQGDNTDCTTEQNSKEFAEQYYNQTYNK